MNKAYLLLLTITLTTFTTYTMNNKPTIFFITGTSGSGKTTLVDHLRKLLSADQCALYDFDENGVPENADQAWRIATTNFWLHKTQENNKHHKITIVCGVSVPSEIIKLINDNKHNISPFFGFIKIDDATIKTRLLKRSWNEQLINDNINWAHHLETEVKKTKNHYIVETNAMPPTNIANQFAKWILSKRQTIA